MENCVEVVPGVRSCAILARIRFVKPVDTGYGVTRQVFDRLRDAIISGELEAGELYSTASLGSELGVSRTPIREASLELARLGLVQIERNRGIRIIATSVETLVQGFEVRLMLEVPLARRATQRASSDHALREHLASAFQVFKEAAHAEDVEGTLRADRDFHTAMLSSSGNKRAMHVLHEQRNIVLESGFGTVPESRTTLECFEDHQDIYDAFMVGDTIGVTYAMRRHICHTATLLVNQEARRRPDFEEINVAARLKNLIETPEAPLAS